MKIYKINASEIRMTGKMLEKPEPILWCRQGMFCIIPIEIIQNAIDAENMFGNFSTKYTPPIIAITWDQGIPVDPKVGYALLDDQNGDQS